MHTCTRAKVSVPQLERTCVPSTNFAGCVEINTSSRGTHSPFIGSHPTTRGMRDPLFTIASKGLYYHRYHPAG